MANSTTEQQIPVQESLADRGPKLQRQGAVEVRGSWSDGAALSFPLLWQTPVVSSDDVVDVVPAAQARDAALLTRLPPAVASVVTDAAQSPCATSFGQPTSPGWQSAVRASVVLPYQGPASYEYDLTGLSQIGRTRQFEVNARFSAAGVLWVLSPEGESHRLTALGPDGEVLATRMYARLKNPSSITFTNYDVACPLTLAQGPNGEACLVTSRTYTPTGVLTSRLVVTALSVSAGGVVETQLAELLLPGDANPFSIPMAAWDLQDEVVVFSRGLSGSQHLYRVDKATWTRTPATAYGNMTEIPGAVFDYRDGAYRYAIIMNDSVWLLDAQLNTIQYLSITAPSTSPLGSSRPTEMPVWCAALTWQGSRALVIAYQGSYTGSGIEGAVPYTSIRVARIPQATGLQSYAAEAYLDLPYQAAGTMPVAWRRANTDMVLISGRQGGATYPGEDVGALWAVQNSEIPSLVWSGILRHAVDTAAPGTFVVKATEATPTADQPANVIQRSVRGCLSADGLRMAWPVLEDASNDTPGLYQLRVSIVDLVPQAGFESRVVRGVNKTYMSGGFLRCFDGVASRDVARSVPVHLMPPADTGTTPIFARYAAARVVDATGEELRGPVSGPVLGKGNVTTALLASTLGPDVFNQRGLQRLVVWEDDGANLTARASYPVLSPLAGAGTPQPQDVWRLSYQQAAFLRINYVSASTESVAPYTNNDGVGEVGAWAPPAAADIALVRDRLVMLDATHPSRYFYSKPKQPGVEFEFAAELTGQLPGSAGRHVAVAEFDGNLVIIAERGVYAVGGEGLGATVAGQPLSQPRLISYESTLRRDRLSVVRLPNALMWHAKRGFVRLVSGWQLAADPRIAPRTEPVRATLVPAADEVLFSGALDRDGAPIHLAFNYRTEAWSTSFPVNTALLRDHWALAANRRAVLRQSEEELDLTTTYTSRHFTPAGYGGEVVFNDLILTGTLDRPGSDWQLECEARPDLGAQAPIVTTADQAYAPVLDTVWTHRVKLNARGRGLSIRVKLTGPGRPRLLEARVVVSGEGRALVTSTTTK